MTKISDFPDAGTLTGAELVPVLQGGVEKVSTIDELSDLILLQIQGNEIKKAVTATQSNSAAPTTPVAITELTTNLAPGTYKFEGVLLWQAAATGTGIQFYVNCSGGTISRLVMNLIYCTTATSAATGVLDGTTANTGQLVEGKSQRTNNTASGFTAGVDTANADVMAIIDIIITVTLDTQFQLLFNSSAASANVIQDGTHLLIKRMY